MIFDVGLSMEVDAADLGLNRAAIRNIKKTLGFFPPAVFEHARRTMEGIANQRAIKITRFSVSAKTQKWRKWAAKKDGYTVPTYVGVKSRVLAGPRVGKRTGTFTHDLRTASPPGVEEAVTEGIYGLNAGTFVMSIMPEAFENEYPEAYFLPYLIGRGIIPEEGYLAIEEKEQREILDELEALAFKELEKAWGGKQ